MFLNNCIMNIGSNTEMLVDLNNSTDGSDIGTLRLIYDNMPF